MGPIVLILSFGYSRPLDIVTKLSNLKTGNKILISKDIQINESQYQTYDYNIKNKYFEIDIKLLPYDKSINTLPKELLKLTEALIVSFDSSDKSFLTHVPKLCKLSEDNNIELGLLLTGQLYDDANDGLLYGDVKDLCKQTFDVIEISNQSADDEKPNVDDYSEIIEALENHLWTNVVDASTSTSASKTVNSNKASDKNVSTPLADGDLDEVELEAYEALLTNVLNFKNNSANFNRHRMLDEAEKLAELFTGLMGDD